MTRMTPEKRRARELRDRYGVKYTVALRWVREGLTDDEINTRAEAFKEAAPPQPEPDKGQGERHGRIRESR